VILYDGDCGVCARWVAWAVARLRPGIAQAASQSLADDDLRQLGLCREDVRTAVYWVDGDGRTWRGALGAARALQLMGGWWGVLGHVAARPPVRWGAQAAYTVLSRNRRWIPTPGPRDGPACELPAPTAAPSSAGSAAPSPT
jgi:predicted DCC family thiol-disulfide oxidoreductase YuxK